MSVLPGKGENVLKWPEKKTVFRLPKKKWLALFLAALAVLLFVWLSGIQIGGEPRDEFFSATGRAIRGCVDLNRSYNIPSAVFEALPQPPRCFVSMVQLYQSQQFSDDFFFGPSFFLQPEFYPSFLRNGLHYWTSPISTHWGAIGFGAFPSERTLSVARGQTIRTRFFFHSGFGVRSFQGMRVVPRFQTPTDAQSIHIKLDTDSQNGFLLGPSFPKFDAAWAKPIDLEITADATAPVGNTGFVLKTEPADAVRVERWQAEKGILYYNATDFVGEQTIAAITLAVTD